MINMFFIEGKLVKDSVKFFDKGKVPMAAFDVIEYKDKKSKDGELTVDMFRYPVKCFGKSATDIKDANDKCGIFAQGFITQEKWDYNGKECSKIVLVADRVTAYNIVKKVEKTEEGNVPEGINKEEIPF